MSDDTKEEKLESALSDPAEKREDTDQTPPLPKDEARPLQSSGKGGGGGGGFWRRGLVVYDKVRD